MTSRWRSVLELSESREVTAGSTGELVRAISAGADLRINTDFRHNEHIDVASPSTELVREVSDFPLTYVLDARWAAGIMTLRQPVSLSHEGFGRPSMSFFLYNQDGVQGIARPYLDGGGVEPPTDHSTMAKYHELAAWDTHTRAPSSSFVYDFDCFRYLVRERWKEVLSHDSSGEVISGSIEDLASAVVAGSPVKVGISGLFAGRDVGIDAEIFVEMGPCYFYSEQQLMIAESRPVVLTTPSIPLTYGTGAWDFGWLILRTDGSAHYRRYEPGTLRSTQEELRLSIRWFVEDDALVSFSETKS